MKDQKARNCLTCKWAEWYKTSGKLSPTGGGECAFSYVLNPLPVAMHWPGGDPKPVGRYIIRKKLKDCPCWKPMDEKAVVNTKEPGL